MYLGFFPNHQFNHNDLQLFDIKFAWLMAEWVEPYYNNWNMSA